MSIHGTLVALETSGAVGSVAVAREGRVVARRFLLEAREHASAVVPAVAAVLDEAGLSRADLTGVVVGAGPGSFTGVRVAAATGKGLAYALRVPLWAVSSLEAGAVAPEAAPALEGVWGFPKAAPGRRAVLFDARGRRLFVGAWDVDGPDVERLVEPRFATLDEVLAGALPEGVALCGEGALRHRSELEDRGHRVLPDPAGRPTADGLVRRLLDEPRAPVADPWGWEPDYLRSTGAEREAGTVG